MSVYSIYFSPTNSTKEIVNLVANEFGSYQEIDLSKKEDMVDQVFDADDVWWRMNLAVIRKLILAKKKTWSIKYLMQTMFV